MSDAFIKLYRKLIDWEWYDDTNTFRVFTHCLLRANWKPCKWHGVDIEAGQFITSLANLAEETHLTVMQVRTALNHLILTGEITSYQQGKFRIITVNNWCQYQGDNKVRNKVVTRSQQGDNKVITTDKEYKEREEEKELKNKRNIYGEYRHVRLTDAERDRLFNDYGESETLAAIKFLDEYKERKGYTCKNDNLTLRKWVFNAVKEERTDNGWLNA